MDAEWKYARSLLYIEYISDDCAAAVPLNTLQPLRDVIAGLVSRLRHCKADEADPPPSALAGTERRGACYNNICFNDFTEVRLRGCFGLGRFCTQPGC